MFGIFSRKKRAEDAGRELANALILTMPFNQGQVENVLMAMRSPPSQGGSPSLAHSIWTLCLCDMPDAGPTVGASIVCGGITRVEGAHPGLLSLGHRYDRQHRRITTIGFLGI